MAFDLKSVQMSLSSLQGQVEKDSSEKKSYKDDRFWKPTRDDSGNAYAIIRFLPPAVGETVPWAKYYDFAFKGPTGQWYFEKSLRSIEKLDPVGEYNRNVWADQSGTVADVEERQKGVKRRKARLNYIFNIYVIKDSANPANEGKNFLFRAGSTIYKIIKDTMYPEFPDEKGVPVFDFLEGADFKVKVFTQNDLPNYTKSGFDSPSPFLGGDADAVEKVYNKIYPLQPFTAPDQFKSYDELKTKLYRVLALDIDGKVTLGTSASYQQSGNKAEAPPPDLDAGEEDDDAGSMSYFKDLAES